MTLPPVHESWLPKEHALHRPRHGRRQRFALVCAVLFLALPLISFAVGLRPSAFENRKLTAFPTIADGWSFFTGLSPWATDHLPFRQGAIGAGNAVSQGLFGELPAYGGNGLTGNAGSPAGPLPVGTAPPPVPDEFPTVLSGTDGWLYLGAEFAGACDQAQPIGAIVAELAKFRDVVVASGRRFVVVIAPDKATIVSQHLPADYPGKACYTSVTARFWQAMSRLPYVLDLRADLVTEGRRLGSPVYGPQDGHWSDEGGVIMAQRMANALQPGLSPQWTVEPGAPWQVPADLPTLIDRTGTTSGRHYVIRPDGVHDTTPTTPFPDYETEAVHFDTATGPGVYTDSVGLIADSFTIRASPYLASVFGDMTVLGSAQVASDNGVAAGKMLVNNRVVAVEVAERTLITGQYTLLDSAAGSTIMTDLAEHPLR